MFTNEVITLVTKKFVFHSFSSYTPHLLTFDGIFYLYYFCKISINLLFKIVHHYFKYLPIRTSKLIKKGTITLFEVKM